MYRALNMDRWSWQQPFFVCPFWHMVLKAWLSVTDQLLPYATAAFNWFLNEQSQESPHFLYFRHDPYLPHLTAFLQPKLRYLGSNEGVMHLDKLKQAYMLAALKTKEGCFKQNIEKYDDIPEYKIGDFVMIKNFNKKLNWDTKHIPNFRIVRLIGTR